MKKTLKTLLLTTAFTAALSITSFAAETKQEYKEEVAPIQTELQQLTEDAKALRTENLSISTKYREICQQRKNSENISIDADTLKKVQELRKEIKDINDDYANATVKTLRADARTAMKANDFDTALDLMEEALKIKKDNYENLKKTNKIWEQIDALLN